MRSFGQNRVQEARSEWDMLREVDRVRRDRLVREREQRDADLAIAATTETLRQLRRDVVVVMHNAGELSSEQCRAASEVAKVYQAIAGAQAARTSRYDEPGGGGGPLDWSPYLERAYRERYKPWANAMGMQMCRGTTSIASLVFLIVCDNRGCRQVADHLRMDQRTVKRVLQQALYAYAEHAGWIDSPDPAAVGIAVRSDILRVAKMTA